MKIFMRRPSAIRTQQFDLQDPDTHPKQMVFWDIDDDPLDGSCGYIESPAGVFKVFIGDWICYRDDVVWVVEGSFFDVLYVAALV